MTARLSPGSKVLLTMGFAVIVLATPRNLVGAFVTYAGALAVGYSFARVRAEEALKRLRFELPVLVFAAALPLLASGPTTRIAGFDLAIAGLWAAWNLVAKSTLTLSASGLLLATTSPTDILVGLRRLGVPAVIVSIAGLMHRYLQTVTSDARRLRYARLARADDPRTLTQARGLIAGAGTLFVRSYERGERVHLAMVARGFDGTIPDVDP